MNKECTKNAHNYTYIVLLTAYSRWFYSLQKEAQFIRCIGYKNVVSITKHNSHKLFAKFFFNSTFCLTYGEFPYPVKAATTTQLCIEMHSNSKMTSATRHPVQAEFVDIMSCIFFSV